MRASFTKLAVPAILTTLAIAAPPATAQQATLFAVLNGANECNGASPPLCGQGDSNGVGSATVMLMGPTTLCATIIVNNIAAPSAAHIHSGRKASMVPWRSAFRRRLRDRRAVRCSAPRPPLRA